MWAILALATPLFLGCGDDQAKGSGGAGGSTSSTSTTDSGTTTGTNTGSCGTGTATAIADCVEQSRYEEDLKFIAAPRPPGSAHHTAVRELCAKRFAEHGFTVEEHDYGSGVNVIGVLPGASDERVIVSAHYDSTDASCPGADDNATGVAGVLESARVMAAASLDKTLVVACWDEEEDGLVGSDAYAGRAKQQGDKIIGVYVYEMLGYVTQEPNTQTLPAGFGIMFPEAAAEVAANDNRGDFIAIIGDVSMQVGVDLLDQYAEHYGAKALQLTLEADQKNSPLFGDLRRSDHAPFWERDFPALHMTDTSNFRYSAYHCGSGPDVPENLDHGFSTAVIKATVAAASDLLGVK